MLNNKEERNRVQAEAVVDSAANTKRVSDGAPVRHCIGECRWIDARKDAIIS